MPKTVLVVDDSASIQEAARLSVAGEPWSVEAAGSAAEAMQKLEWGSYDAVLCDVALGKEDGYDLVREIRKIHGSEALPVILMGAKVSATASMAAGANATLPKPFSAEELIQTLSAATAPAEGLILTSEDLMGLPGSPDPDGVEVIDLSGDEDFAELELLEGLEPIQPGVEPSPPPSTQPVDDWGSGEPLALQEIDEQLDLILDEIIEGPLPEGPAPAESPAGESAAEEIVPLSLEPELAIEPHEEEPEQPLFSLDVSEVDQLTEPVPEAQQDTPLLAAALVSTAEKAVREALTQALTTERLAPAVEAAVERVVWEVVPPLAERLILEAIEKLRREPPKE